MNAFPIIYGEKYDGAGLTKFEFFLSAAIGGLLANPSIIHRDENGRLDLDRYDIEHLVHTAEAITTRAFDE